MYNGGSIVARVVTRIRYFVKCLAYGKHTINWLLFLGVTVGRQMHLCHGNLMTWERIRDFVPLTVIFHIISRPVLSFLYFFP